MLGVARSQETTTAPTPSPTPSITPGLPEEQICNYASYVQAVDFEIDEGLAARELQCRETVDNLRKQQFGPPTEWEIFNTMCKGECRSYADRLIRIDASSNCRCARVEDPDYACFTTPTDYLCQLLEICKGFDSYINEYCLPSSCGRFAGSEAEWREARSACGAPRGAAPGPAGRSAGAIVGSIVGLVGFALGISGARS